MAEIKIYGKLKAYTEEGKVADASDISGLSPIATEGLTSAAIIRALGYTPGTSNFSGAYADLTGKPTNVSAFTNDAGYLTQHQSLEGYATQTWVQQQGYLTQHQSLEGYATQTWVQQQGYLTSHQDISGKANKNEVIPYYRVTSFDCNNTSLSGSSIYRVNATPAHAANSNYSVILNFLDLGTPIQIQIPDAGERYIYKRTKSGGTWLDWFKISAGDSDTVAGLTVHSGRNNEANKVVRTDKYGYIQAGYINSSSGDENNYSEPGRIWGTNAVDSYLRTYNAASVVVGKVYGTYSGNGGQQGPDYYGRNRVGFLMSNQPVNGYTNYTNWMYMDNYNGDDVGGATAIGVARTQPRAFIMQSDANRSSWNNITELISVYNISSYAITSHQDIGQATLTSNLGMGSLNNSITWGTTTGANGYTIRWGSDQPSGGGFVISEKDGQTHLQIDGEIWVSEGQKRLAHRDEAMRYGYIIDSNQVYFNATSGAHFVVWNLYSASIRIRLYHYNSVQYERSVNTDSFILRILPWALVIRGLDGTDYTLSLTSLGGNWRIAFYCPSGSSALVQQLDNMELNPLYD